MRGCLDASVIGLNTALNSLLAINNCEKSRSPSPPPKDSNTGGKLQKIIKCTYISTHKHTDLNTSTLVSKRIFASGVKLILRSAQPPTGTTPSEGVITIPGSGFESRTFKHKHEIVVVLKKKKNTAKNNSYHEAFI